MTSGSAPGRAADRARTIFFGSGAFAVPVLDTLLSHPRLELSGVVTAPDRPAGRGKLLRPTPVALRAQATWVPLLKLAGLRDAENLSKLAELRPELGVLADFGQIVPRSVLDLPSRGILNVHPSLLPRHRGASPIQATIAEGDTHAGVTVMLMDDGVDTGPIVAQQSWALRGDETFPELESEAARRGADLLFRTIGPWLDGESQPVPQAAAEGRTWMLKREHGRLDPNRPAVELERQVRAFQGWPGSFIDTDRGRVLVQLASTAAKGADDEPGVLVANDGRAALTTSEGRLVFEAVQLPGRRAMTGEDFLHGYGSYMGARVLERADDAGTDGRG